MDNLEKVQEHTDQLVESINKLENPNEKLAATINAIIDIGQNQAENMFEFFGLLEEIKFIVREEVFMDEHPDGEFVDDDMDGDLNLPFSKN